MGVVTLKDGHTTWCTGGFLSLSPANIEELCMLCLVLPGLGGCDTWSLDELVRGPTGIQTGSESGC